MMLSSEELSGLYGLRQIHEPIGLGFGRLLSTNAKKLKLNGIVALV